MTGRFSAAVNYTSAQRYVNDIPAGGGTIAQSGDPMMIGRVGMAVDAYNHWTATLFVDNVNNERGAVTRGFLTPDLYTRVRSRTAGLQLEYHYK